ncbi:hypothetical protein ACROYT_G001373 [Oculina patagonica]
MAELEQRELETPVSTSSPVTSTTPATKPAKNPKRVVAGKLAAEKTKQAREAQKKAAVEAAAIIAKEKEKKSASAKRSVTSSPSGTPVEPAPTEPQPQSSGLTTNQWISLLGIGVAIVTTYVKREDIKAFINEKRSPTFKAPPTLITDDTPELFDEINALGTLRQSKMPLDLANKEESVRWIKKFLLNIYFSFIIPTMSKTMTDTMPDTMPDKIEIEKALKKYCEMRYELENDVLRFKRAYEVLKEIATACEKIENEEERKEKLEEVRSLQDENLRLQDRSSVMLFEMTKKMAALIQ